VIIVESRYSLDLLKIRSAVYFVIKIHIDNVLEFMDDIEEMAVLGELQMPGSGFKFGVKDRALFNVSVLSVDGIHIDVIHSEIRGQKKMIVPGHLYALYMGAEIPLRNTAEALEEELVADLSYRSVFIDPQYSDLSVVIAGNEKEFILIIRREVRTSHSVDRSEIDPLKISSLDDPVSLNSEIGDGIQILPVMRDRDIRRVGDLNLLFLSQIAFLHVNVIDPDPVLLSLSSCVGRNISDELSVFFILVTCGAVAGCFFDLGYLCHNCALLFPAAS
jgi:hypothetical protein